MLNRLGLRNGVRLLHPTYTLIAERSVNIASLHVRSVFYKMDRRLRLFVETPVQAFYKKRDRRRNHLPLIINNLR